MGLADRHGGVEHPPGALVGQHTLPDRCAVPASGHLGGKDREVLEMPDRSGAYLLVVVDLVGRQYLAGVRQNSMLL